MARPKAERVSTRHPSLSWLDDLFEERREGTDAEGSTSSTSGFNPPTMLYLKDNKTRHHPSFPLHDDTLPSRLKLMLYRRLLSQLVAKSPLYDFKPLWERLGLKSHARLPTKLISQANLISDNTGSQPRSLDDLVTLWHELVKKANIQGINENLELVYRLGSQRAASENSTAGPSNDMEDSPTITEEEAQLQWALRQPMQLKGPGGK